MENHIKRKIIIKEDINKKRKIIMIEMIKQIKEMGYL